MCGPALSEVMAKGRTLVGKQVLKNGCPRRVDLPRWAAQASWGKDDGEGTTLRCVGFPTGLVSVVIVGMYSHTWHFERFLFDLG